MAKAKKAAQPAVVASGRGSPEAIQKRRVARKFNDLLSGKGAAGEKPRDGRTEKRRQRLLAELDKGTRKGAKGFSPIDLLRKVNDLIELGEPISSIRKVTRVRPNRSITVSAAVEALKEVQASYNFKPASYKFLGLPHDALVAAKLVDAGAPRRGRPPKNARS